MAPESGAGRLHESHRVLKGGFATAGECSTRFKMILKKLGVNADVMRRVAIASYEAEMNLVIHSEGGEMAIEITPDNVRLISRDDGPGIRDIDLVMREGYSTASEDVRMMGFGAGMGLPNMKRCADGFSIESTFGVGTEIVMDFRTH